MQITGRVERHGRKQVSDPRLMLLKKATKIKKDL